MMEGSTPPEQGAATSGPLWQRLGPLHAPIKLFLILICLLILWFGVLGAVWGGIGANIAVRPSSEQLPVGGSVMIGYAAYIIDDNVNARAFTPNDPAFYPTGTARRSRAFQRGVIETLSRVITATGEATSDPHLLRAADGLMVPADRWWLGLGWPPIRVPAEIRYREALDELVAYNNSLTLQAEPAEGQPNRLLPASRVALAALIASVDREARLGDRLLRGLEAGSLSEQLSRARGTAYTGALLLRGIRDDNRAVIRLSGNAAAWGEALDALERASQLDPLVVRTSDLVEIGYSLLLAENAMRTILEPRP